MSLLIVAITLPLVSSCLLLWKCGLVINLVVTHRGIVSHVGTLEALDMSHLLLLLNLAHAFVFFLQGAISYMVTLFLVHEASDESSLVESCTLVALGALLFYLGAALPHWDAHCCILEPLQPSAELLYFGQIALLQISP